MNSTYFDKIFRENPGLLKETSKSPEIGLLEIFYIQNLYNNQGLTYRDLVEMKVGISLRTLSKSKDILQDEKFLLETKIEDLETGSMMIGWKINLEHYAKIKKIVESGPLSLIYYINVRLDQEAKEEKLKYLKNN